MRIMKQKLKIICKTGQEAYEVILTAEDVNVFLSARNDPAVKDKAESEELVAAILQAVPGKISKVERYKEGKLNDGANGEPARQRFASNGSLLRATHYKNGKRNNGLNGEPAVQWFGPKSSGKVYCEDGKRQDGPDGEPAVQKHDNDSGKLIYAVSCKGDKRVKIKIAP